MNVSGLTNWQLVVGAATAPATEPPQGPDPVTVTPGLVGFLVTFAVVAAGIVLANIAARKVRKIRARAGVEDVSAFPVRTDPRLSRQEAEQQMRDTDATAQDAQPDS